MHNNSNVVIHPTKKGEREQIAGLVKKVGSYNHARADAIMEWVDDFLKNSEASMYRCLTAYLNGKIVGFGCFGPRWLTESTFDIHTIIVDPEEQRKGIGSLLLHEIEGKICAIAGELVILEISSLSQFSPAHKFLNLKGYRIEADIADFYAVGENQVTYSKKVAAHDYEIKPDPGEAHRIRKLQKELLGYNTENNVK